METKKIKLDIGECEVRGCTSSEFSNFTNENEIVKNEYYQRIDYLKKQRKPNEARRVRKELIHEITEIDYIFITKMIINHNFNIENKNLLKFLKDGNIKDFLKIKTEIYNLSHVNEDLIEDLSQGSNMESLHEQDMLEN